ncbi:MAG: sugar ABC transporter permease [Spirochaetales bacterium]|nr:sugar ABC transporter permease [Spirochaetales bacterium]
MNSLTPELFRASLGQVGSTVLLIAMLAVVMEIALYLLLVRVLKHKYALPIMLLAPAAIGLMLLVVAPILYELRLAFSDMNLYRFKNPNYGIGVGLSNFARIFTEPVLKQVGFFPIFFRTMLWTGIQVVSHVTIGLFLAILLNRPMKLRGLYRTILIIPWAMPQVVAVLAWRGEFSFEYGFLNIMLKNIGLAGVAWKTHPFWNYVAMNLTNIWLGVPFMMVILLGGLQSIPSTYYEAAEIDGANWWGQFRNVTIPMIKPVMTPAIVLGVIWTFNNFNVPYFINQYELETSDILVTALFRAAFEYNRYGFAAAFAFVIFFILLLFSVWYVKVAKIDIGFGQGEQKKKKLPKIAKTAVAATEGRR